MIASLIIITYLTVSIVSARRFAMTMIHNEQRKILGHLETLRYTYPTREDVLAEFKNRSSDEVGFHLFIGLCLGLVWPFTLPFSLFANSIHTPLEKELENECELEKLRKLAKEHGLEIPEVKS